MRHRATNILFLGSGETGIEYLIEASFRDIAPDNVKISAHSLTAQAVLPEPAVKVSQQKGLVLRRTGPAHLDRHAGEQFDIIVTLDEKAKDKSPDIPGNPRRIYWQFEAMQYVDKPTLTEASISVALENSAIHKRDLVHIATQFRSARELYHAPGTSTCIFQPEIFNPAKHLPLLAEVGFKCIELCCIMGTHSFPIDDEETLDELANVSKDVGVQVYSVHVPGNTTFWLPGSGYGRGRAAVDMLKYYADVAAKLGAHVVVLHAGRPWDLGIEEGEALLWDTLHELEEHALSLPCIYVWENGLPLPDHYDPQYDFTFHTPEEHIEWIQQLNPGAFGLALDTGHSNLRGTTERYLAARSSRLRCLHLHDNDGKSDQHWLPGEGVIEWAGFRSKLDDAGYVGPLLLEAAPREAKTDIMATLRASIASLDCIT